MAYKNPKDYKKAYNLIKQQIETDFDVPMDYWYIVGMISCASSIGAITGAQEDELKDIALDKKYDVDKK